jgi:transposase InsO family protein
LLETQAPEQAASGAVSTLIHPRGQLDNGHHGPITQLPRSRHGYTAVATFVDKLSKMTHFAPTHTTVSAPDAARLFLAAVVRLHGWPTTLVSDRDPKFTSAFWTTLFKEWGTKLAMSTAYHPQTDGQSERANRTLEEMLRSYVSKNHDDWDVHLPTLEFALSNSATPPPAARRLS